MVAPPSCTTKKVRIALLTVMDMNVHSTLEVIEERDDTEIAVVLSCVGPKSRRSDAYIGLMQALYETNHPNVDVIVSNKKSKWADLLALYDVDLIMCCGFPWILPADLLSDERFPYGVVNFHNAELPKMRGPNAFGHAIINGHTELTFTAHRMEATVDTGPILVVQKFPFPVNQTVGEFLSDTMPLLFSKMVDAVITKAIARDLGLPQIGVPTEASMFTKAFRWIDFNATAIDVHNKIRGFYGVRDIPLGAWAKIDGRIVRINRSFFRAKSSCEHNSAAPGTIVNIKTDGFHVQCGDMALKVVDWQVVHGEELSVAKSCCPIPENKGRIRPLPQKMQMDFSLFEPVKLGSDVRTALSSTDGSTDDTLVLSEEESQSFAL